MKFVSKNSNYRLILRPGIQAEPLAGRPAIAGVSVRFEDGIAKVDDPELINALLKHPKCNVDFVAVTEENEAVLTAKQSSSEPEHSIMNVQYGHVGQELNPKKPIPLTPELKKAIAEMAVPIAQEMAMTMLKQMVNSANKAPAAVKAKGKGKAKAEPEPKAEEETSEETESIETSK